MTPLIATFPGNEACASHLATALGAELLPFDWRRFPDGESFLRLDINPSGREVIVVCSLDRPDDKFLPLAFLSDVARELGARSVTLVAPYLAYMRQDARFAPGEAVTSRPFARLVSQAFDGLVTVDPHLHRYDSLSEVYSIPTRVVAAAPAVAQWIREHVQRPVLVGPDEESAQWVEAVAKQCDAPHVLLRKVRRGDRNVEVTLPDLDRWTGHVPVLFDDIISTAHTMVETVGHLTRLGLGRPICVGVHAVFADDAHAALKASGAAQIVTANTIAHVTNAIDVHELLVEAVGEIIGGAPQRDASVAQVGGSGG